MRVGQRRRLPDEESDTEDHKDDPRDQVEATQGMEGVSRAGPVDLVPA